MAWRIIQFLANPGRRPWVRPWALLAPVLVLVIAVPLVRLRNLPDLAESERSRLATVQALVEQRTLAIDHTRPELGQTRDRVVVHDPAGGRLSYSKQPPVLAFVLAGPYWVMHRLGMSFDHHADIIAYLLIVLGITLPVATAAGMIYRLGRIFELPRPWRAGLALAAVLGSGLVSYATVLNSNAPAAALILVACACMFHAAATARPRFVGFWLAMSGLSASLAAVIDLAAPAFMGLFVLVIVSMAGPAWRRAKRVGWYALGTLPPLALHAALTIPITGDILPGFLHPELLPTRLRAMQQVEAPPTAIADGESEPAAPSPLGACARHCVDALVGSHGVISHFPVVVLGLAGIGIVLRRHWPKTTKAFAVATLGGGIVIGGVYITSSPDWTQPMFAVRWFVIVVPLLLFWAGAWLRKKHHPATWAAAAILLAFSVITSIIGATNPFVPTGRYTAYTAARSLFQAAPAPPAAAVQASVTER